MESLIKFGSDGIAKAVRPAASAGRSDAPSSLNAFDTRAVSILPPRRTVAAAGGASGSGGRRGGGAPAEVSQALKDDLAVVAMRGVLDRKRFYKSTDLKKGAAPAGVQVGTVIEGPTEFFSARLTHKERRSSMVAELMSDGAVRAYAKRKFLDVQRETQRGGKKARKEAKKGLAPKWSKARH